MLSFFCKKTLVYILLLQIAVRAFEEDKVGTVYRRSWGNGAIRTRVTKSDFTFRYTVGKELASKDDLKFVNEVFTGRCEPAPENEMSHVRSKRFVAEAIVGVATVVSFIGVLIWNALQQSEITKLSETLQHEIKSRDIEMHNLTLIHEKKQLREKHRMMIQAAFEGLLMGEIRETARAADPNVDYTKKAEVTRCAYGKVESGDVVYSMRITFNVDEYDKSTVGTLFEIMHPGNFFGDLAHRTYIYYQLGFFIEDPTTKKHIPVDVADKKYYVHRDEGMTVVDRRQTECDIVTLEGCKDYAVILNATSRDFIHDQPFWEGNVIATIQMSYYFESIGGNRSELHKVTRSGKFYLKNCPADTDIVFVGKRIPCTGAPWQMHIDISFDERDVTASEQVLFDSEMENHRAAEEEHQKGKESLEKEISLSASFSYVIKKIGDWISQNMLIVTVFAIILIVLLILICLGCTGRLCCAPVQCLVGCCCKGKQDSVVPTTSSLHIDSEAAKVFLAPFSDKN